MEKVINFFLALFLFLLPLYFLPLPPPVSSDKQMVLFFFTLLLFLLVLGKIIKEKTFRLIKTPADFFLLSLSLLFLLSTYFFSPNKTEAFTTPFSTGTILIATLLYFTFTHYLGSQEAKTNFFLPLVLSSALVSLLMILSQTKVLPAVYPLEGPLPSFTFLLPVAVFLSFKLFSLNLQKKITAFLPETFSFLLILIALIMVGYQLFFTSPPFLLPFRFGWAIAMEVFKNFANFLLGIGPINFPYAYTAAKPPALNLTPFWNVTFASSSSLFLNLMTEVGIFAALAYLFLTKEALAHFGRKEPKIFLPYFAALVCALSLQFLLPGNISLFILTIVLLALTLPKKEVKKYTLSQNANYFFFFALLGVLLLFYFQGKIYAGEIFYRQALQEAGANNLNRAYDLSLAAIKFNPASSRYFALSGALSLNLAQTLSQEKDASESAKQQKIANFTQQAINFTQNSINLYPLNSQNYAQLASIYQNLIGQVQGAEQQTLNALNRQILLDPNSPQPKVAAGRLFLATGQLEAARNLFSQAANLKPDWNVPYYNLGIIAFQLGDYRQAANQLQTSLNLTPQDSPDYKNLEKELEQVKALIPPETTPSATLTPSPTKPKTK